MKTKIIYISGNEVFEMAEIRAAFEEVREALGLDKDTILFGVPVDCDNALENASPCEKEEKYTENVTIIENTETIVDDIPNTVSQEPTQVLIDTNENTEAEQDPTPAHETVQDDIQDDSNEKIIPILSVLAAKTEDAIQDEVLQDDTEDVIENTTQYTAEDVIEEKQQVQEEPLNIVNVSEEIQDTPAAVISDINIEAELVAPETDDQSAEKVTISDMINDEAPMPQMEKTLEQLLESMTPLREDIHNNEEVVTNEAASEMPMFDENDADATDATLAQLASEFAENEDKIPVAPKAESHGKIGKLKNILPFKKAKRDDSGLIGDLFGWAGIAANDDDFSMPGFFTGAKKQGA